MTHEILALPRWFTCLSASPRYKGQGNEAKRQSMTRQTRRSISPGEPPSDIFDRAHLAHYTMNSKELEAEIIGLFLVQLPSTLDMLERADSAADWKLYTHTLKGSAAAVGARRLQLLAIELEAMPEEADNNVRKLRLQSLRAAVAEFRETVRHIYP